MRRVSPELLRSMAYCQHCSFTHLQILPIITRQRASKIYSCVLEVSHCNVSLADHTVTEGTEGIESIV